jgi:hypothetical protein
MRGIILSGWLAAAAITASTAVSATVWTFEQGGWSPGLLPPTGGVATGFFAGTDRDGDGKLVLSEVTDFLLTFSGDRLLQDFRHDLDDLRFFSYTIGSTGFPPSFPFYSSDGLIFYDADDGTIGIDFGTGRRGFLSTSEPMAVAPIPVPATFPLLFGGFAALLLLGRRRMFRLTGRDRCAEGVGDGRPGPLADCTSGPGQR